ncbi:TetR family transcriptional regulator [Mycolicibacterium mageritense DSM 44476 = CIP 104973]
MMEPVATRKYEQRLRAETADETRRRVLAAVHDHLTEDPTRQLSLDKVARNAGVARSTIYGSFGSKAGLLDAFAEDLWARSGLAALTEAVAHSDVREHVRGGIVAATRMFAAERDVYRALFSMAKLDPGSVGAAVDRMQRDRRGGTAHLAQRLADADLLRDGISVEEAAHILWILTSFESFDTLATDRGLAPDEIAALLNRTVEWALYNTSTVERQS